RGLPLAVAELELPDAAELLDLDDPRQLSREHLRPSRVATRDRRVTQPQAQRLFREHGRAAGLRWWSTYQALWVNVTVFARAASLLRASAVRALTVDDPMVASAADFLGLHVDEQATHR